MMTGLHKSPGLSPICGTNADRDRGQKRLYMESGDAYTNWNGDEDANHKGG